VRPGRRRDARQGEDARPRAKSTRRPAKAATGWPEAISGPGRPHTGPEGRQGRQEAPGRGWTPPTAAAATAIGRLTLLSQPGQRPRGRQEAPGRAWKAPRHHRYRVTPPLLRSPARGRQDARRRPEGDWTPPTAPPLPRDPTAAIATNSGQRPQMRDFRAQGGSDF
jgi:hypothetical protein